jgi:hypothetical protein
MQSERASALSAPYRTVAPSIPNVAIECMGALGIEIRARGTQVFFPDVRAMTVSGSREVLYFPGFRDKTLLVVERHYALR